MNVKCTKCGKDVVLEAFECIYCGEKDPTGRMAEEARIFKEEQQKEAEKFQEKMNKEIPLDS